LGFNIFNDTHDNGEIRDDASPYRHIKFYEKNISRDIFSFRNIIELCASEENIEFFKFSPTDVLKMDFDTYVFLQELTEEYSNIRKNLKDEGEDG